jgi:hypothetical protein
VSVRLPFAVGVVLALAVPPALPQEAAEGPNGAKVWVGHYAEYEEYLRTAPIEKLEDIPVGVTKPKEAFFAPGGLAQSAAVKELKPGRKSGYWESYKSEIAAYEMDRVLGLDMVPPTVERRIEGQQSSLQLWIKGCRLLSDIPKQDPVDPTEWAKQVCRMRIFDCLIANIDRNAGNILVDDHWNIILIDHSRAFAMNEMPFEKEIMRTDKEYFERLKALDEPTLMEKVGPWVFGKGSIRDLLKRRDKIVQRLEKLAKERGEAVVFPFR